MEKKTTSWSVRAFMDLVELFDSKTKAFVMVTLILIIVILGKELRQVYREQTQNAEQRLQRAEDLLYRRLEERFQPEIEEMRKNTDSAKAKVDTMVREMHPVLERVTEVVDKIDKRR